MSRTSLIFNLNESLIFEISSPGKKAYSLPDLDVDAFPAEELVGASNVRDEVADFPQVSEVEIVRHFTRLSTWNYHIDLGLYPLGSCTMKYNPKLNERVARLPGIAFTHPLQDTAHSQGCLEIIFRLQECLKELTGLPRVTLQPAAGSQGELTGILMVRAFHANQRHPRRYVLIPDSAHGTNPASAVLAGYQVISIPSDSQGRVDIGILAEKMNREVACLMLTNPNTLGIFEENIETIAQIVHAKGGLLYMDGANFNALLGQTRPGEMGIDVLHLNLHKTFSTPHGGGGPGAGPVACGAQLGPFLPTPVLERHNGSIRLNYDRPLSIGRLHAFYGNFGMLVRALCYILSCGKRGLREISETAVLNANYIRKRLENFYQLAYSSPSLHEVVFSDKLQNKTGVKTLDIAKRLIDYGFHPPTIYFPLIVQGALMIEPTESPSKQELDAFVETMITISREASQQPSTLTHASTRAKLRRLDEAQAARFPILRWEPAMTEGAPQQNA